jgi:hypothetical protein
MQRWARSWWRCSRAWQDSKTRTGSCTRSESLTVSIVLVFAISGKMLNFFLLTFPIPFVHFTQFAFLLFFNYFENIV